MALKGRKPDMNSCARGCLYQEVTLGTSLGTLLVRLGGRNSSVILRPTTLPTTVSGKCTKSMMAIIKAMVVKGKAAVELDCSATPCTNKKTAHRGPGKTDAVSTVFHTQSDPFSCLYKRPPTSPPNSPHRAYMRMAAVSSAPLRVALNTPSSTHSSRMNIVQKICAPEPMKATNRVRWSGLRNTSPWIIFQPVSSSASSSSSISMYLEKSFFRMRIRMMARKAVRSSTSTKEFMMDSQWISKVVGRKVESA
mmetsp:Transcript_4959/g.11327  ORF Transcript_4959/g.11327 Transcript_4959/m.11327 type:complete len:251 (-) Transcript_4959:163-915(-)